MKPLSLGIRSPSRDWHEVVAGFRSQADAKAWLAEREALAQSNRRLREGLECCLIKIERYREQHGDAFIGGVAAEYDAVAKLARAALKDNDHG